ncbi:BRCA1-associated RING domain protein 1 [Calliopsis andreniformis]|uniref:BRCA1-associated RING domain protein 1 n=1 Tax=Calliopsis andreniformis TaxID=337506 RepID=UPI003FCD4659
MDTSWKNTRKALKNFTDILGCNRCGNQPVNAIRYTNCDHFFCEECIGNDSICTKCNTPVQPIEIQNDHIVKSLVSYCNIIAEIIKEKDLWNTTADINSSHAPSAIFNVSKARSRSFHLGSKHFVPKKDINKRNEKGETRLHIACLKENESYVKTLLAAGANPNTKDNANWTPLQEVVNYGYSNICKLLLECGASPNTPGSENRTALHEAAIKNRLEEAKMLLQYSAKRDVYDEHGKRPIDYCEPYTNMWKILNEENEMNETVEGTTNLNCTLDQSSFAIQSYGGIVIYASNLKEENRKLLQQMASKHKVKVASVFRSFVTHVIVEANYQNIVPLSYDVMMALLRGNWLINSEWIQLTMDVDNILSVDLELFEISGTPIQGIPRKARENEQNQNPRLFNQCHFYFALHAKNVYYVNGIELTKDSLTRLVQEGNGTVLKREPNPEHIESKEQTVPFHIANEPSHPLYKCTHYVIYVPGKEEPRVKYNMPHLKTLPLMWLIECIEKFALINPLDIGLL